mgnify:FL=1
MQHNCVMTKWLLEPPPPAEFFTLIKEMHITEERFNNIIASLLWNRGFRSVDDIRSFLYPDYDRDTHNPFLLRNMDKAVQRIIDAIKSDETLLVFSDYDADGVCGAAILTEFFNSIGKKILLHIPNRLKDPYGLTEDKIQEFIQRGVKVLITIDCGVTDEKEIGIAQQHGIDVIVIDHHIVPPRWPFAAIAACKSSPG